MIFSIDKLPQVIPIGIQTESGVGEICFDVKPWVDAFGSLTMSVWLTRPGDSAAYPAENVNLDGNILCWTPNEVDTAISGMGRVEILGFAEGKRKLSGYCDTIIQGTSLSATQDPPDGLRYWVDKVVEAGEQAMAAVDKMPTISEEGTWMLWDPVVKVYADSGLPSRGKAGDKGDNGVGIQSVTQTTTSTEDGGKNIVTVTKTDGSKSTFAVMNGRKGKDGTGVTILGSYESEDALKAAHPTGNAGDAYLIDGYLYVWSVKDSAWKNVGKIQGPQGEPGSPGATGPAGSDGRDGTSVTITNVSTSSEDGGSNVVTFSDGKTMTVKNGRKGKDGLDGKTPVAGVDYYTAADKAELVEEVKSQIGEVDGDYAPAIHADQHSWNDTLTWDGDTTGRVSAHYATGVDYYLVSDKVPTVDDIANGYTVKAWDKIADKEHCFEGSFSRIEEWGCLCSDGGIYDYTMAIVPTDNYTIEMYDITFPKKGIYFLKCVSDFEGVDEIVTSLTIPGYAFDEGTDPITPEMISAAPHNHASESPEYGVGTAEKFGHLKVADLGDIFIPSDGGLMALPPEMDEDDPQGSLKNYAFSAFMGYVTNNLFATWLTDVDNQLTMTDEIISALKKEVNNLKSEVEALKGGS